MDTDLDRSLEITAHVITALAMLRDQNSRLEQRDQARLRQQRKRLNAPTRASQDTPLTRSA